MNWIQTSVFTKGAEGLEIVSAVLDQAGISQVELIEDAQSVALSLEQSARQWDYCDLPLEQNAHPCVRFFVSDDVGGQALLAKAKTAIDNLKENNRKAVNSDQYLDLGTLAMQSRIVAEEDWANNWKEYFKPFPVGEKILICPTWEQPDPDNQRQLLYIDPGMVFGTGLHQTTQLCLEQLEKLNFAEKTVLDIGCGSGILSIGAMLFGAKSACAIDIEHGAPSVVAANAAANNIHQNIDVYCGDILADTAFMKQIKNGPKFDIIVANIVANVIIALAGSIPDLLAPGGIFICSGIIEERLDEVIHALKQAGLNPVGTAAKDDWYAVNSII